MFFGILFHLTSCCFAKTDRPNRRSLHGEDQYEYSCFKKADCAVSRLAVVLAIINPDERSFKVEVFRSTQRNAMLRSIDSIFRRIEYYFH